MSASHPFSFGLLVGRFQMPHLGHQYMIDTALAVCDRVGVLVGSAQESGTAMNPFSYELRYDMLRELYDDRIAIAPLPDIGVGNTSAWGNYVLLKAQEAFGAKPDLVVSGAEGRRISWFHKEALPSACQLHQNAPGQSFPIKSVPEADTSRYTDCPAAAGNVIPENNSHGIAELYLPKIINISASEMRAFLLHDNYAEWSSFIDPRLHGRYEELRGLVLASDAHKETGSL
ncbi:MAG: adenylyltransferase/cytidyltransferase family protein [Lachnospiraceae bacterium]|nr:adenylyltransferase/cytidyltransferase family protein [Lachnospiraceae bacterium]